MEQDGKRQGGQWKTHILDVTDMAWIAYSYFCTFIIDRPYTHTETARPFQNITRNETNQLDSWPQPGLAFENQSYLLQTSQTSTCSWQLDGTSEALSLGDVGSLFQWFPTFLPRQPPISSQSSSTLWPR